MEEELKSTGKNGIDDSKKFAEIEELKKLVGVMEKKVTEYKQSITKEKSKHDDLNNNLTKSVENAKKLQTENTKLKSESDKTAQEKKKMEQQIENLNTKLGIYLLK